MASEAQLITGNGFVRGSHSCEAEAVHIPVGLKQRWSQEPGAVCPSEPSLPPKRATTSETGATSCIKRPKHEAVADISNSNPNQDRRKYTGIHSWVPTTLLFRGKKGKTMETGNKVLGE